MAGGASCVNMGWIVHTLAALRRLAHKLGQQGDKLRFCYEAGP